MASCTTTGQLPAGGGYLLGVLALAAEHRGERGAAAATPPPRAPFAALAPPPPGPSATAKRHPAPSANSAPSGVSGGRTATTQLRRLRTGHRGHERGDVRHRPRAHAPGEPHLRRAGGHRLLGLAERLLEAAQGVAQLVLAEHLAQARAVGLARGLGGGVEVERHVAVDGRQALGDARVLGVRTQVLFALGAGDVGDVREHLLQGAVALDQVGGGLVADAGDPGDVVGGVALQPVEVGDQLRRDAVAVNHRLAVVRPWCR